MASETTCSSVWGIANKLTLPVLRGRENAVYSPACIHEGLRALCVGSAGVTKDELIQLVGEGAEGDDPYGLPRFTGRRSDFSSASLATGVWIDNKAVPSLDVLSAYGDCGISLTQSDFSVPDAGIEISNWIAENTKGLLHPVINLEHVAACLASALYLKDSWANEFSKEMNECQPFHADGGDFYASYMVDESMLRAADYDCGTIVERPFSSEASMVFVLPREDLTLSGLLENSAFLEEIACFDAPLVNVELHLPKFTCKATDIEMCDMLARAGFSSAAAPDLSPLTGLPRTTTSYVHGAKLTIDEEGIEAASVFAMAIVAGIPSREEEQSTPWVIKLDRPFLYAVISQTGQPLFVGTVTRPRG